MESHVLKNQPGVSRPDIEIFSYRKDKRDEAVKESGQGLELCRVWGQISKISQWTGVYPGVCDVMDFSPTICQTNIFHIFEIFHIFSRYGNSNRFLRGGCFHSYFLDVFFKVFFLFFNILTCL